MEPRRFAWQDQTGSHEIELAWVAGTSGVPYGFGHDSQRRAIDLRGFYISRTQITQALWMHVMGENPSIHQDAVCPVENISFEHIHSPGGFLNRINQSDVLSGVAQGEAAWRFRLPSETEWEYAARGGPHWQDDFAFSGSNNPDEVAWYGPRWGRADEAVFKLLGWPTGWHVPNRIRKLVPRHTEIHPVAKKAPNQLGLFDMSGNVWEWCEDVCIDDFEATPSDGTPYTGPGTDRRLRGGCHHNWDLHCRVWWRYGIEPAAHDGCIGFRLVLAT